MGLYCIFDGVAGAGAGTSGTGASIASIAELLTCSSRDFGFSHGLESATCNFQLG